MKQPEARHLKGYVTHSLRLVEANESSLKGLGLIVRDFDRASIEIVRWPAQGWRAIDPDTGDQAGTVEGLFEFWWEGNTLFGRNDAVGDSYLLGWSRDPNWVAASAGETDRSKLLMWHANYHPDGGQLFFPKDKTPFVAPLAPPGDDVKPESFTAFYCDGSFGLYIHPGVWHEATFPLAERQKFQDKQGAVHARVSCNFLQEFGTLLDVPLAK